jgi:hypothetical protein
MQKTSTKQRQFHPSAEHQHKTTRTTNYRGQIKNKSNIVPVLKQLSTAP